MDIKSGVSPANHITSETAVDVSDLRLKHLVCSIVLPARQATCRSTPYVYAKRTEGGDGDGTQSNDVHARTLGIFNIYYVEQ